MSSVWGSLRVTLCWTAMNIYAKGDVTWNKKLVIFRLASFINCSGFFCVNFKFFEKKKKRKIYFIKFLPERWAGNNYLMLCKGLKKITRGIFEV